MYWTLFLTFVKIGMFTIGGGYAMLPLIQRDVVDRGWMTNDSGLYRRFLRGPIVAGYFRREYSDLRGL